MTNGQHLLSIIVVAYNEEQHIARLHASIKRLVRPSNVNIEAILIDGGSRDGTSRAARESGFDGVIDLPGANIPACRNRGLIEARGDWVAFVDADCELAPDWLEKAVPLMMTGEDVLMGWPAVPPEPMTWVQAAWRFHWAQKNPRWESHHGQRVVRQEGFRLTTTRNMILHRAVAEKIKGFNEELATGEDTDFAYRAYLAGVAVLGNPALEVIHYGEPATLAQFFRQQRWHANRKSYEHIMKATGGKVGGNAPRFAAAFLVTGLFAIGGLAAGLALRCCWPLLLAAPFVAIVAGPALLMSVRGRSARYFPALVALYFTYGLARAIDLAGLAPAKPSWKVAPAVSERGK